MTNNNFIHHTVFKCTALEFDLALGSIKNAAGESLRLSPINLKLLAYLLAHQDKVVSRAELFDAVWPNQIVSEDVLTRAVSDIRTQLGKLDASTKYIETLPKRGYRWLVKVVPLEVGAVATSAKPVVSSSGSVELPSSVFSFAQRRLVDIVLHIGLAMLLAGAIMWGLAQSISNQINLAVLPASYDRPQIQATAKMVDDSLLKVLRKNPHIKLLSKSAIASRPQNPFPYFFSEFGAAWVLESRVSDLDGVQRVELSLVDARTGLELRSASFDATTNTELQANLARKLETRLLVDDAGY